MGTTARVCARCEHYRLQEPPDPFVGIRLLSAKSLELRTRWQQELATRAELEEQRYLSNQPFDFEPIAYPWCAKFSGEVLTDSITGGARTIYVLCVERNPDGNCSDYGEAVP